MLSFQVVAKTVFYCNRPDYHLHVMKEVAVAQRLQHPNIVRCFGTMQTPQWPVVFMEYVPGMTLQQMTSKSCKGGHPLSECSLREIFSQLLAAMHYLQGAKLVHW